MTERVNQLCSHEGRRLTAWYQGGGQHEHETDQKISKLGDRQGQMSVIESATDTTDLSTPVDGQPDSDTRDWGQRATPFDTHEGLTGTTNEEEGEWQSNRHPRDGHARRPAA